VITVLRLGKRMVLKCFLDIKRLFKFDEAKYPLNLLYIDDYCVYLQTLGYVNTLLTICFLTS
jgi:hypothetical protein